MLSSDTMDAEAIDPDHFFKYLSKDDGCDVDGESLEVEKVEKGRERNREHAKRTRLRKKAVLEGMKGKLMELQNEVRSLTTLTHPYCTSLSTDH